MSVNKPRKDLIIETLVQLGNKIDGLDARLDSVDKTLVKQEVNLDEHMRRTELAEVAISELSKQLEPVKKHVFYVEGALKGIGIVATLISVSAGLIKIFLFISSL